MQALYLRSNLVAEQMGCMCLHRMLDLLGGSLILSGLNGQSEEPKHSSSELAFALHSKLFTAMLESLLLSEVREIWADRWLGTRCCT